MTSIDFLEKTYKTLDNQQYRVSFYPAQNRNWMMLCNGDFVGGLFDEELCLLHTDAVSALLHNPEPVFRGVSPDALHSMLVVPPEMAKEAFIATCKEKFEYKTAVYDITYTGRGAAVLEDFYDENIVFLKFCFDSGLLKQYPLDKNDRIVRMVYRRQDLTPLGIAMLPHLVHKFLVFYDRKGTTGLLKMLPKWFAALEKKQAAASH